MTVVAAKKCSMCEIRDMVPVPSKKDGGGYTTFVWCPNCDNPNGKTPKFK